MFNFEDGELETKNINGVEIFAVGTHNGKEFDESDLEQIVNSYRSVKNEIEAPIKAGHSNQLAINDGMPALGWVDKVYKSGKKIKADFKNVPKKIANLIKSRAFKKVSIELLPSFTDSEGNQHEKVLSGVALLGADTPAVKTLDDIPKLFDNTKDSEVETFSMEIEFQDGSVHEPEWSDTSSSRKWSNPNLEDFDTSDLSQIDNHFIFSMSGFPPENFTDLKLPVVDPDGTLIKSAVDNADARLEQTEGLSEIQRERAQSIINNMQKNVFNEGDGNEQMSESELSDFLEEADMDKDEFAEGISNFIEESTSEGGNSVDEEEVEELKQERDEFKDKAEELEEQNEELADKYSELQEKVLEYKLDSACQELALAEEKEEKFRDFVTAQVEEFSDERAEEVIDDAKDLIGSVSEQPDTQEYTAQTGEPESGEESVDEKVESVLNS